MARTISHAGLAAGTLLLLASGCGRHLTRGESSRHRPAGQGLTFTIRVTGTSFDNRPARTDSLSSQFAEGVLRIDFPSTPDPSGAHRPTPQLHLL